MGHIGCVMLMELLSLVLFRRMFIIKQRMMKPEFGCRNELDSRGKGYVLHISHWRLRGEARYTLHYGSLLVNSICSMHLLSREKPKRDLYLLEFCV